MSDMNFLYAVKVASRLYMLVNITILEPPRGKTNNVVSEQVRQKSTCTVTEKS